jgi:hypothetical protein
MACSCVPPDDGFSEIFMAKEGVRFYHLERKSPRITRKGQRMKLDTGWFDRLRKIDDTAIAKMRDKSPSKFLFSLFKVDVGREHLKFTRELADEVSKIFKKKIINEFKVNGPGHIYTYSDDGYCSQQFHIAFRAMSDPKYDFIAFGIAYKFDANAGDGAEKYKNFKGRIQAAGDSLQELFEKLNFFEINSKEYSARNMAERISEYSPKHGDWVFIGEKISIADPSNANLLADHVILAPHIAGVFSTIEKSGFFG